VGAHAREERREASGAFGLAPRDERGVDREAGEETRAIALVGEERSVEQELGADVRGCAARTAGTVELEQAIVELAHEGEDRRGLVEDGIGAVMERDTDRDVGIGLVGGEASATHRGEVRQHRAERLAGGRGVPARDRRMPEIVHTAW